MYTPPPPVYTPPPPRKELERSAVGRGHGEYSAHNKPLLFKLSLSYIKDLFLFFLLGLIQEGVYLVSRYLDQTKKE